MEEKNNLIIAYINEKVQEFEKESMYVPKENITKLINLFMNKADSIEAIKTRIDRIFADSKKEYNKKLESMGYTYEEMMSTYNKIEKMNKTRAKLYLTGGIVPYVLLNDNTGRKHESLDLLCNKKDIDQIRELFRKKDIYDPKRDSLTYTSNNIDYGLQVVIDKIKVNIFVFEEKEKGIVEYDFDCRNKIGRIKQIPTKMTEYIMPYVSSDNKKYNTLSLELLIAEKLVASRDKDQIDIDKIKECNGISDEKIKKLPLPIVNEYKLVGDNLEYTSTMPRIKLDIPGKNKRSGFINIGTILLLIAIVTCIILSKL